MGCDIHIHLETFNKHSEKWENRDTFGLNHYIDVDELEPKYVKLPIGESEGRDYTLFSILADVRNSTGITPIAPPRGMPKYANKQLVEAYLQWEEDAHSVSYFTLAELIKAEKKYKQIAYSGYLTDAQITRMDQGTLPNSWYEVNRNGEMTFKEWTMDHAGIHVLISDIRRALSQHYCYIPKTFLSDMGHINHDPAVIASVNDFLSKFT